MPPSQPLGIGILGAGFIAESHAGALAASHGCRLVSVADLNRAAAESIASRHGAGTSDSLDSLLEDPAVDAVIVCTPNDTHARIAMQVAAAGRHLLMEKPLALSVQEARSVQQAFDDAGLTLLAGHTHRHSDYALSIHQLIAEGGIGTPRSMRLAISGGWIWGGWRSWVLDPARSGGHAFHNGVHLYDLARWWLDSPLESAWATGQRRTSSALAIDDALTATFRTASGASAICEVSRGERPRSTNTFEVVVHGTEGTLLRSWNSDGQVLFSDDGSGAQAMPGTSPFLRQIDVFCAAISDGTPLSPSTDDAIHALAAAEAVERSLVSGTVEEVRA